MSASVAFILLDLGEHPIEFARSNLAAAEFADARRIYLQRRAAVRAVQISARRPCLRLAVAYEGPVFTPAPQIIFRSRNNAASCVNRVIKTLRENAQRNRIVESVHLDLHRLHRGDLALVERVSQSLSLVRVDPVAMHLENVI